VRFADHLAAFTDRRFQAIEIGHGSLLARRLGWAASQSRPVTKSSANAVTLPNVAQPFSYPMKPRAVPAGRRDLRP